MAELPDQEESDEIHPKPLPLNNKELWLISLPFEIEPRTLSGKKFQLGSSLVKSKCKNQKLKINDKSFRVEVMHQPSTNSSSKVTPILPAGKSGKLSFHKIMGEIVLRREPKINDHVTAIEPPAMKKQKIDEDIDEQWTHLKQRWKPFGWKTPSVKGTAKDKKKKKRTKAD
ncbi:PREDICTED: uncharacterized protein LOC105312221 [Amphimedon queenslandica]|uniref:Uncharacterized protein n=1 Tax=Amphimedon queenslandica TaxID=400682 RepID=A0A1X7V7H1_AMPQE|nr:PREDICTED: uncharacterized protein LOC105312221 [Amphimedon queenslandica]|eukprot:XP_011402992.1 PREDICTED: uncharacterized protein LOC105312221 [Amphimedon queenslandica]